MKLVVTSQSISVIDNATLVGGTVNKGALSDYTCTLVFDDYWSMFTTKYVHFKSDSVDVDPVLVSNNSCLVPPEILVSGTVLRIGVFGTVGSGTQTNIYPTVWSDPLYVRIGSYTDGEYEPTQSLFNQLVARVESAVAHYPYVDETTGNWFVWDSTNSQFVDTEVHAQGDEGDDGYSPTVSITTITGGHRLTITDKTGSHSADILDGAAGTTDFEQLSNRPKYNGSPMTSNTDIPVDKAFLATYNVTTSSEIASAVTAGKAIFLKYTDDGNITHQLMLVDESNSKYGFAESTVGTSGDITSVGGITIALAKEDDTWEVLTGSASIPTKTSDLTNDGDGTNPFLTEHQSLSNYVTKTELLYPRGGTTNE